MICSRGLVACFRAVGVSEFLGLVCAGAVTVVGYLVVEFLVK